MSIDDVRLPGPTVRGRREGGFSMIEIMVALIIIMVMATIVEQTLGATQRADQYMHAVRRVTLRCEKVSDEVLFELNRSRKLFQGDATGDGYLSALDLTQYPILPTARLPVFDEVNPLAPDLVGDPRTGNVLLFVVEAEAAEAVADASTGKKRSIDLHHFVCVYPHETARKLMADSGPDLARDLILWHSVVYPSHSQIQDIADLSERASVVRDLVDRWGCAYAWDSSGAVDAAFYALGALGTVSTSADASLAIEEDLDLSRRGRLVYADVQLAPTRPADYFRRSRMTADDPVVWVPDGCEVKIVGVSGARKIWYRLTMETPGGKSVVGVQACTVTASPRDM